ncbi:hypothetical protein MRX96_010290 [Rhipicephalus microplus]
MLRVRWPTQNDEANLTVTLAGVRIPEVQTLRFLGNKSNQMADHTLSLLSGLGYQDDIRGLDSTVDIPDETSSKFKVASTFKRMHVTDHQGRRRARVQSITKAYQNKRNAIYIDAATFMNGNDAVVTIIGATLKNKVSASLKNSTVLDAEEATVALVVAEGNRSGQSLVTIPDSQDLSQGYTYDRVGRKAAGILKTGCMSNKNTKYVGPHDMRVSPGMFGSITCLDNTTREMSVAGSIKVVACTYRDILQHFKQTRMRYPSRHNKLDMKQSAATNKLLPMLKIYNEIHLTQYRDTCT